jgi:uncharacterized protein (TIGR02145 family)
MKNYRFLSVAIFGFALAFIFSCSSDDGGGNSSGGSCDISSFQKMPDGKTWMTKNLNCNVDGSVCYNNDPANCNTYGRLYSWKAANKACPKGWHLPGDAEWEALVTSVGGAETAGTKLKATSGWRDNGNGTDDFGFSALPGGISNLYYSQVEIFGYWWSSTEYNASNAYLRYMISDGAIVVRGNYDKAVFFSVRCVQD